MAAIRFRPAGWVGRFDEDFTQDNVARLACAIGAAWSRCGSGKHVYVGYDGRWQAKSCALLAARALSDKGLVPIVGEGVCPLPALSFATAQDENSVGALAISVSESSCDYGGLILRGADGGPVSEAFTRGIERRMTTGAIATGGDYERKDIVSPYLADLAELIDLKRIADAKLRIVLDPMHGAASGYLFRLLERIGCSVTELHGDVRSDFGGIHPEPIEPWADTCEQLVVCQHADIGLLINGGGDRAALVDERGRLVGPHNLAPLILAYLAENQGLTGRVVTTLASSLRLTKQAERLGLPVTSVPVGFERIYGEVLEGDVLLAGEEYGGICLPSHLFERDGLLVCLLALELLSSAGCPLSELVGGLSRQIGHMDYVRRSIRLDPVGASTLANVLPGLNPKNVAGRHPVSVNHADGLRLQFEDGSWSMLRPSRARLMMRVYAEAPSITERDELLAATIKIARDADMWRIYGDT